MAYSETYKVSVPAEQFKQMNTNYI